MIALLFIYAITIRKSPAIYGSTPHAKLQIIVQIELDKIQLLVGPHYDILIVLACSDGCCTNTFLCLNLQMGIQVLLVLIALACVPCMLIVKTMVLRHQHLWKKHLVCDSDPTLLPPLTNNSYNPEYNLFLTPILPFISMHIVFCNVFGCCHEKCLKPALETLLFSWQMYSKYLPD